MLPMDFCGTYPPRQRRRVVERVGIVQQAHKLPAALSGGQQQRAAVARALANDPPLLMADEPTGNLDSTSGRSLFALFEQLSGEGKTLIVVTHSDELAARAKRVVTMTDGRIGNCGRGRLTEFEEVRR
jgi:putative ABC transport system ATP-binding protein